MIFNLVDFVNAAANLNLITTPTDRDKLLALANLLAKVREGVLDQAVSVCQYEAEMAHAEYRNTDGTTKINHFDSFSMAERLGHKIRSLKEKENSHDAVIEHLQKTEGCKGDSPEAPERQKTA